MRRFELILAGVCAAAVVWPALFGTRPRRGIVLGTTLAAAIAQLVIEGYRWQMFPLYVVALGLGIGDLLSLERKLPWWRRVLRPMLGLIGVGTISLLSIVLPVPRMPAPSGPLEVGTMSLMLTFPDRLEHYGDAPDTVPRKIMVQVWYPAESVEAPASEAPASEAPASVWNPDLAVVGPAMSRQLGFPGFFLSHTKYTTSNAIPLATPLDGMFPLVLYSHGWTGFRTIALNQVESLASNGYVVIAADHAYGAIASVFPDGSVIEFDPNALPDETVAGKEAYDAAAVDLVEVFTDDLVGILDALALGPSGPFGELALHIDLGLIGVYGHSTGGGAAARLCLSDERCDALLGLDAWIEPIPDRVIANESQIPMLFMRSDGWRSTANDGRLRGLAERSVETTYWIGIEGAGHNDFVVTPLFSPVGGRLGLKGPIPAARVIPIIDRFLVGFFDHVLLGSGPAAVEQNPFPEVSLEVIGP